MENIERAIACFDKKLTDYQIYVDRELQNQSKSIKSHENYLINTLNSQNKKIDNSIIALGLKETATGKTIALNDVLDIKHKCLCKLSSDTYEKTIGESNNIFETPKDLKLVTQYGDMPNFTTLVDEDGSIYLNGYTEETGHLTIDLTKYVNGGQTYTWSLRDENGENPLGYFIFGVQDENYEFTVFEEIHNVSYTFTVPEGAYRVFISYDGVTRYAEFGNEPIDVTVYPQLEEGSVMTDWVPFGSEVEQVPYIEDFSTVQVIVTNDNGSVEYTPDTNGIVEVDSFAPNMTIETSNEHCNIEFVYYIEPKKYIDKKIAEMVGV